MPGTRCRRSTRHPGLLITDPDETVEVHEDLPAVVVDVHVGRRDVGHREVVADLQRRRLTQGRGVRLPVPLAGRVVDDQVLDREVRLGQMQRTGPVDGPGAGQLVGVSESDVGALVVGEVQVVPAERIGNPVRHPDQGRTLDVGADARIGRGVDDRRVDQSVDGVAHAASGSARTRRRIFPPRPRGISSITSTLVGHL